MTRDEYYPGAPLVSVAFELRHPASEPLLGSQRTELQRKLAERFPLMRSQQNFSQTVEFSPAGPVTQSESEEFPRFLNRARTMAVSILQTSLLVETTNYPGWNEFRKNIEFTCKIRNEVSPIYGVERIGLRYIDEVRVTDSQDVDWSGWISESLLGGSISESISLPLRSWQGVLIYGDDPGQGLALRYGPGHGYAIDPNGELRRVPPAPPAPFFMLDIDSFWVPTAEVPEYDAIRIMTLADELHAPVRETFESSITDKYREELLRA